MYNLVQNIPDDVEVYIVGGAIRNALVYDIHGEVWRQRDYDQIITKNSSKYFAYLESLGFQQGAINDPTHRIMTKATVQDGRDISYEDNLVFDIHIVDGTTIEDNLRYGTGLMINGAALSIRDIFSDDWKARLYTLPGAIESIEQKQMRINPDGYESESNYFFALIRFIGMGFAQPPHDEIIKLFKTLKDIEPHRYQRNLKKLEDYVGGRLKVIQIVNNLNIDSSLNIFDEAATRHLIDILSKE